MNPDSTTIYYGVGIYSVAEAARLTGVSAARVRRWIRGYTFRSGEEPRTSLPVWKGGLPVLEGRFALNFLDLLEVRFIDAFLRHGVSWPTLRAAECHARQLLNTDHPFATNRFRTDGRKIFATLAEASGEKTLMELASSQFALRDIVAPYLVGLEFSGDEAIRWWPLGKAKRIVLDPGRSFGQPIVNREGVPTAVLAEAYEVEQSDERVARWYDVEVRSVQDAVAFEAHLAGRQAA